jgi:hypothetical protein
LPIIFGFLALALMAWDYENQRMVQLMGMGWDMGPPFWPYQAVYDLLFAINTPAFVISIPILRLLSTRSYALQYGVWFLAIVAWWWWIGTRIDFGVLGRRQYRHAKWFAGVLAAVSVGLLYGAIRGMLGEFDWWTEHGRGSSPYRLPTLFSTVGPVLWCFILSVACLIAAKRLLQEKVSQTVANS